MKKIASLFFSILLLVGLAACNGKEDRNQMGGARKAPDNIQEPVEKDDSKADESKENDADSSKDKDEDTENDSK